MLQRLLDRLGMGMVPYLNLVVVPLMGLTSDPLPDVRAAATSAFAPAVALLPLAQVIIQVLEVTHWVALQSMSLWPCCNAQGNSMTLLELLHPHLCSILSLARRAAWLVASDMGDVQGIAPPDGLDKQQKRAWQKDSVFLSQLLDNTKV